MHTIEQSSKESSKVLTVSHGSSSTPGAGQFAGIHAAGFRDYSKKTHLTKILLERDPRAAMLFAAY